MKHTLLTKRSSSLREVVYSLLEPKMDASRPSTIDMFVDGACLGNGKDGARAAWAWACAVDHKITETHAEVVPADRPQTNQYAELAAFAYAFLRLPPSKDQFVTIYSDSAYAINCIRVWGLQWKANGWARKPGGRGKPLEHLSVIAPLVETYLKEQVRLDLVHISAHPKAAEGRLYPSSGNVLVDKLAQAKAQELTQELSVSQ